MPFACAKTADIITPEPVRGLGQARAAGLSEVQAALGCGWTDAGRAVRRKAGATAPGGAAEIIPPEPVRGLGQARAAVLSEVQAALGCGWTDAGPGGAAAHSAQRISTAAMLYTASGSRSPGWG